MDVKEELKLLRKFTKKIAGGRGVRVGVFRVGGWCQGGCERGIEVFVKIQKTIFLGGGGGEVGSGGRVGGSGWM